MAVLDRSWDGAFTADFGGNGRLTEALREWWESATLMGRCIPLINSMGLPEMRCSRAMLLFV
jgi:hypothetical protein